MAADQLTERWRIDLGWPTPNHMRHAADALDMLIVAKYGDVLRWVADQIDASLDAAHAETPVLDVERLAQAMVLSGLMRRYADYANSVPTMAHGTDQGLAPAWAVLIAREYARLSEERPDA